MMQMNMVRMFVLTIFFGYAVIQHGVSSPVENLKDVIRKELHNVKIQVAMECAAVYPVDNSTIRQIMTHEGIPDEQEAKINNGKIDWKKGADLSKMVLESDDDKRKVDQISELCEKEVFQDEEDECQLAYNTAVCKFMYGKKLGLPNGTWDE